METEAAIDPFEYDWDINTVARFFGGIKPLHQATVYRAVKQGTIPAPYFATKGSVRWVPAECRAAKAAAMAKRGNRPKKTRT